MSHSYKILESANKSIVGGAVLGRGVVRAQGNGGGLKPHSSVDGFGGNYICQHVSSCTFKDVQFMACH